MSAPPSRLSLRLKALLFRTLNIIASYLDRHFSAGGQYPAASPIFHLSIPSTVSKSPGSIPLLFYGPKTYSSHKSPPHSVVINFHGGGFTIGAPNNDARFATAVIHATSSGAVMISVGYRLAPEHPHPVGIEDGSDAILWLWAHAREYNLDPSRVVLSGFSAGGNMSLSVALRLHAELEQRRKTTAADDLSDRKLAGIISFYPGTNSTLTRAERSASNKFLTRPSKETVPGFLYSLFDSSYLYPPSQIQLSSPYLSPRLAPSQTLRQALPDRLALFTCEWDQLHAEGETFRKRLREEAGKRVGGRTVMGVDHAFDKAPSFGHVNGKREVMYAEAVRELRGMLGED